ncbi:nicotinate-nucleotide adenylyltransferase [Geomicrobium sp. JCM 19037]|uniref:nicotinate-nucleotide adenylyltransferase n=1 Tax=Geomicrobium sp. JCM 19037 TaxID=1460634 RepID=UPI000A98B856|nr:nicotinate-nucleotide adenylyltransferase [Geomicrobium sp. JCM 19037]
MRKIGIFGGTFDPVHIAHLILAEQALNECSLDEVWFMPANIPPHKKHEGMADGKDRAHMVELAIQHHPQFKLLRLELARTGPSYTVDTIEHLLQIYPNEQFYFIIGGDMVKSLERWHQIDRLRDMVRFIVTDRPDYSLEKGEHISETMLYIHVPNCPSHPQTFVLELKSSSPSGF